MRPPQPHRSARSLWSALSLRALPAAALTVLAAGLASGCGGSRTGEWAELGPADEAVPIEPGRRCFYGTRPGEIPALETVVPASARGGLRLWGYGADGSDTLQVSIRYGPTGALQWVRVIGDTTGIERAGELERLLGRSVPRDGRPDWGVRLELTTEGTPVGVLPAVVCEPFRISRMPTPAPVGSRGEMAEMRRARGRSVEVRVLLDDHGRVAGAELAHGSGSRLMDGYILSMVRDTSFRPFLHDGFPVAGVTTVRFDLEAR